MTFVHSGNILFLDLFFMVSSLTEDGKTLRLEYTSNDMACTGKHRRSDNLITRTIIHFECGNSVGGPVYIPRSEDKNVIYLL